MRAIIIFLSVISISAVSAASARAQCPARPLPGSTVQNPPEILSQNGVLTAGFTLRSSIDQAGFLHECYVYQAPSGAKEAPTLRLNPSDHLVLTLTNHLSYVPPTSPTSKGAQGEIHSGTMMQHGTMARSMAVPRVNNDVCTGGNMAPTSTNIHFHGLNVPPKCHQDDVILTDIENTDPPFEYNIQIPNNEPPGMYWYHPHVHGSTTLQVNGGAAGALIVQGIEKVKPQVAGLTERILIMRQQFLNPNNWLPGPNQLTINYQPSLAPLQIAPAIKMKPGTKEFWRVANSSTQAFLALQVQFGGTPQKLELIVLDGVPVSHDSFVTTVTLPPASRGEFIVPALGANQFGAFQQIGYNTGPIGNANSLQEVASIQPGTDADEPPSLPVNSSASVASSTPRFGGLDTMSPTAERKLYFSEATNGSNGPTEFFITVDGQTPKVFGMNDPPAIVTQVGAVEDWTVENRTGEVHAFHMHQIHFLYMERNGVPFQDPELRDTVIVPYWNGKDPYPTVKLRMDFRDPEIAGTFVYHCHILDHEDAGMMAKIQVNPK